MSNKPTAEERLLSNMNVDFRKDVDKMIRDKLRKFIEEEKARKRKEKIEQL